MKFAAAAVMPRITMLTLLTTSYNSLFGLLFGSLLGAWCLLVSYKPLESLGIISYAVGRDAGIGADGREGRLLDEVGGETQERRARRGRGRGAVGLGGCIGLP